MSIVNEARAGATGATSAMVGAVDIGATKVLVGLADDRGHLHPDRLIRFDTPRESARLVEKVASALSELVGGYVLGVVSCAAPGPLDTKAGVLLNFHNRDWTDVPLGSLLAAGVGAPVVLEDDATAAALGEAIEGAGAGLDPIVYLTVSSGVGAGIVSRGKLLRGAHGLAGEIGHLVIDADGPRCGCGRNGDVESFAGGLCLARRAAELWPERLLEDGTPAPRTPEEVFDLARRGDPCAAALAESAGHAVARAIAALAAVADPERIVIGGSVALAQPDWVEAVTASARELCMVETGAAMDVVPAALGEKSALTGAALLGAARLS